jgi:hypothetical protein
MATSVPITLPQASRLGSAGSPLLWRTALVFLAFFVLLYAGTFIDSRLINGVSVWEKPAKFFLSLSLQLATLAWGLALLPVPERQAPAIRITSLVIVVVAVGELIYIAFRASRGEASHYNQTTFITAALYMLMGVGAMTLAGLTSFLGWRILRRAPPSPLAFASGLGFMLAGLLAAVSGWYLGAQTGHWVGGDQTDTTGLPFFHWSTTGGDLRVAHFFGLHIMQALPVLGFLFRDFTLVQARGLIVLGAIIWTGLTALTFFQALAGRPFIAL